MGLEQGHDGGSKIFMSIFGDQFNREVKSPEGFPKATQRTNKLERQVWEVRYKAVSNVVITNMSTKMDGKFGPELKVEFTENDTGEVYSVGMGMDSDYCIDLLKRMCAMPSGLVARLSLYQREEAKPTEADPKNVSKKSYFLIKEKAPAGTVDEDGKAVEYTLIKSPFAKDDGSGMPDWIFSKHPQTKKTTVDKYPQIMWLLKRVAELHKPFWDKEMDQKIKGGAMEAPSADSQPTATDSSVVDSAPPPTQMEDDLPF